MTFSPISDARFGARTAVFAAYTSGTLARFELEVRARGLGLEAQEALIAKTMRRYGHDMSRLFGLAIDAEGLGPRGWAEGRDATGRGRVFVSNHRSALDILATIAVIEGKHVSRADLAQWPVVGPIARRAGILFVEREDRRSAAEVVKQMIGNVERGVSVIIFPEGTTYPGDEVRPFMPGAFAVSRRTGCEVVPLGIAYGGEAVSFGDESFLEHMRRVAGARRTRVAITVGEPFTPQGADTSTLSQRAQGVVQALVHRSRARLSAA